MAAETVRAESPIALLDTEGAITYDELQAEADAIAAHAPERSVIFVVASNTVGAVTGYAGFLRRKVVAMMIRKDTPDAQLAQLVEAYAPQFVWAPEGFAAAHGIAGQEVHGFKGYTLTATGTAAYPVHPDLALMITTSGSTGSPKFVRLSYENVRSNALSIAQYQGITPADRAITTLPFSYTYGISIVNSHLMAGASIAVTDEGILAPGFWKFLDQAQATNFGGVPYTYQMLDKLKFARRVLPSLRFISQAGGRLGEALQEKFARTCADKGIEFYVMYGQTEATARISWLPPEHALDKLGSIGIAIPGGELEVRDLDTGAPIEEPDVDGELVYKGPNVSMGYALGKDDLALGDERGGVLRTGDIAHRDADGFYRITGRLKRFLKVFGNRVSLDELEGLLEAQGWLCAAHGQDNHLVVSTTADDTGAIMAFLRQTTGLHPSGLAVRHVAEIPHTSAGKVDYMALNAQMAQG